MGNDKEVNDKLLIPHEVVIFCSVNELSPIAAWRVYRGISQHELAIKADILLCDLISFEQLKKSPTSIELKRLACSLGIQRIQLELIE